MNSALNFASLRKIRRTREAIQMRGRIAEEKTMLNGYGGKEEKITPFNAGTNEYLRELDFSHAQIQDMFDVYDPQVVQATGRVAYIFAQKSSLEEAKAQVPYLLESIDLMSEDAVRHLMFRRKKSPGQILDEFDVHSRMDGYKIVTPMKANIPLELIASSSFLSIKADLRDFLGLTQTYAGQRAMVFDYNKTK